MKRKRKLHSQTFFTYICSPLFIYYSWQFWQMFFSPHFAKQCFIIIFFFLIVIIWLSVVSFGGDYCVYRFYKENNGFFNYYSSKEMLFSKTAAVVRYLVVANISGWFSFPFPILMRSIKDEFGFRPQASLNGQKILWLKFKEREIKMKIRNTI